MMDLPVLIGIVAGVATLGGEIWYNLSILSGRTRPDQGAWWILAFSWILLASSHFAIGGAATVIVPLVFTISILTTAILATFRGVAFVFGRFEKILFGIILVSVGLWWNFDAPLVSLFANIGINCAGMTLNIRKAWRHPGTEAAGPWSVTVLADFVNLFAIGTTQHEWILPCYLFAVNGCMLLVIVMGSARPMLASRWARFRPTV